MEGLSDCELYGHPLVDGFRCPCKQRKHPTRKSVAEPLPYPLPLPSPTLLMDSLLSEKEYRHWKKNHNELYHSRRVVYP